MSPRTETGRQMDEDWREMHRRLRPRVDTVKPRDPSLCAFCGEKLGAGADCSTCGTPLPEWARW